MTQPSLTDFYIKPAQPPVATGLFKQTPADFVVNEQLGFELTGKGEHLCVYVEKTNANTNQIATDLAKWANIPIKDVSFCGLKDKFAVTQQWFSLRIPNKQPPSTAFSHENAHILKSQWHLKKLSRGSHAANQFCITLKDICAEPDALATQLEIIKNQGVPNYFMAQRFGRHGNNIAKARALFEKKRKFKRSERSIILSAARSYLFNQMLAKRVEDNTWNQAILGDVFNLAGSGSIFTADEINEDIITRTNNHDIHPTGALWGAGELKTQFSVAELETQVATNNPLLAKGLTDAGLKQARRALRLIPQHFSWQQQENTLILTFELAPGAYATAIVAALLKEFAG